MGNQQVRAPTSEEVEQFIQMHLEYEDGIDKAREWLAKYGHLINYPSGVQQGRYLIKQMKIDGSLWVVVHDTCENKNVVSQPRRNFQSEMYFSESNFKPGPDWLH